jgi:hypothetical protein
LELDDSEVTPDSKGYLDAHEEWNSQIHNPGYYTGGKIPHFIKTPNSLTRNVFLATFTVFMSLFLLNEEVSQIVDAPLYIFPES